MTNRVCFLLRKKKNRYLIGSIVRVTCFLLTTIYLLQEWYFFYIKNYFFVRCCMLKVQERLNWYLGYIWQSRKYAAKNIHEVKQQLHKMWRKREKKTYGSYKKWIKKKRKKKTYWARHGEGIREVPLQRLYFPVDNGTLLQMQNKRKCYKTIATEKKEQKAVSNGVPLLASNTRKYHHHHQFNWLTVNTFKPARRPTGWGQRHLSSTKR